MLAEPSLRQLRHFLSLAEHCHFSRAAEACLLTQSSLSASIKELETILRAPLFERTKRSVIITPLGRDLLPLAREVIASVDGLMEAAKGTGAPLAGDLRLGVIPTIGPFLLPRVLPGLREAYPELRLYLREEQTAALLRQLSDGSLDLVLLALPYETGDLTLLPFADDPFLAVFPQDDPLAGYETMTPRRLDAGRLLMLEGGHCLSEQILAMGARVERAGQFQATSLHTLVEMVANGLGVTVLPKMAIDGGILRGLKLTVRPFSTGKGRRRIALAWRRTSHRAEAFRLLGEFLRDELATPIASAGGRG